MNVRRMRLAQRNEIPGRGGGGLLNRPAGEKKRGEKMDDQ